MSRSKEGLDQQNAAEAKADKQLTQPKTDEFNRQVGARGQTDYTPGRESFRDFPKRSTALRQRGEGYGQRAANPERSNLYREERRGYQNPQSENRGSYREDSGDLYSRSISEQWRGNQGERNQGRGNIEHNQRGSNISSQEQYADPYRSYDDTRQHYANPQSNWQGNQANRNNPQAYQPGQRRSTTRDFGSPNPGSQNYGEPGYRSPENRSPNFNTQNYDSPGHGQQNYNPRYEGQSRDDRYESQDYRRRDETGYDEERERYNRGNQPYSGYEYNNMPYGAETPYFDANYGYWPGTGYREQEYYRYVMRCRDIMTKDVTTCTPESSIREVAEKMEDDNVGSIPVVENGRLIGLITDRDIVCRVLAEDQDTRTTTVREAMTEDIISCTPDEPVLEAIRKMGEHQIRRLPICDPNGRLRGILSLGDLALEAEHDRDLARALECISEPTPYQAHRR